MFEVLLVSNKILITEIVLHKQLSLTDSFTNVNKGYHDLSFNNSENSTTFQPKRPSQEKILVDGSIRARTVLVIDGTTNENLGVMPLYEALKIAQDKGLNLMQMGPSAPGQTPTCKIVDYGKFRYDESKRIKAQAKKQRESQIEEKEIEFRPNTSSHDLEVKAKKAIEFLENGARVKVNIKCRGREVNNYEVIKENLDEFVNFIPNTVAIPVGTPGPDSRKFSWLLQPQDSKNDPNRR